MNEDLEMDLRMFGSDPRHEMDKMGNRLIIVILDANPTRKVLYVKRE